MRTLSYCNAATLIRASMACVWLKQATVEVAMRRAEVLGVTLDSPDDCDLHCDRIANMALPVVFQTELKCMLVRLHVFLIDLCGGAFLYFRLTERDVDWVVEEEEAMLVFDGDNVDWLHTRDEYYGDDYDVVRRMNLQRHQTLWLQTPLDYLAYTRHLVLHPKYGGTKDPLDCELPLLYRSLTRSLFEDSNTVNDPCGGSQHVWRHEGLGDRHAFWFKCSLCFYDAVEVVARS